MSGWGYRDDSLRGTWGSTHADGTCHRKMETCWIRDWDLVVNSRSCLCSGRGPTSTPTLRLPATTGLCRPLRCTCADGRGGSGATCPRTRLGSGTLGLEWRYLCLGSRLLRCAPAPGCGLGSGRMGSRWRRMALARRVLALGRVPTRGKANDTSAMSPNPAIPAPQADVPLS